MYRWLLVTALFFIAALLGTLLWVTLNLVRDGISLKFSQPLVPSSVKVELTTRIQQDEPLSIKIVELPLSVPARFSLAVESPAEPIEAEVRILQCPQCREGTLVPVRVSLLGGTITWRCPSCGQEFGP